MKLKSTTDYAKQHESAINNAYKVVCTIAEDLDQPFTNKKFYVRADKSVNTEAIITLLGCAGVKANFRDVVLDKILVNFFN